jgi:hypothetical protein
MDWWLSERVLALRSENERLRLELFWLKHSEHRLSRALRQGNRYGPRCGCPECGLRGFDRAKNFKAAPHGSDCRFRPWFFARAAECGLVIKFAEFSFRGRMRDVDAHLVLFDHHTPLKRYMYYGAKLASATSTNSAELDKLADLFSALLAPIGGDDSSDSEWLDSSDTED